MFICKILFVRIIFSSILPIWYVEVRISRSVSEGPFDFEKRESTVFMFQYHSGIMFEVSDTLNTSFKSFPVPEKRNGKKT